MSSTATTLHRLFQAIATASNERELRLRFMDAAGIAFGAQHWGIYLFDQNLQPIATDIHGLPDTFISRYEAMGQDWDPFLQAVIEQHAPVHEQLITESWKQSLLYQNVCASYDHEHVMTGPIVGSGCIVGTVNFARTSNTLPFNTKDLAKLSALCAHLSTGLAVLRTRSLKLNSPLAARLTKRELQITDLVAKGLTNADIGAELWITHNSVKQALKRMFRKLDVSSRTEMVARLYYSSSSEPVNQKKYYV